MTPSANTLKFAAAVGLFVMWAWLVYTGRAPAENLEHGIEAALLGLGVFHAAIVQPGQPAPPADKQPLAP